LCEMGRRADWGDFPAFVDAVAASAVTCNALHVSYSSPSQGWLNFGWTGPLRVAGEEIPLHSYPRFDNPYCQCAFTAPQIHIRRGDESLTLKFR
jgi:hypothetical protein